MNKIAKTALMTGTALCVAGVVLSTAGYFAGGKDFTYASDHFYVSGGNSSDKNLAVMEKQQIDRGKNWRPGTGSNRRPLA